MRSHFVSVIIAGASVPFFSLTAAAQQQTGASQFDPHDFPGIWRMVRGWGQSGPPRDSPALTPAGM